jgi:uncharacterized protein (TIGR02145 family)
MIPGAITMIQIIVQHTGVCTLGSIAKDACLTLGNNWRLPSDEDWKKLAIEYGGYHDWETGQDFGNPVEAYQALMEEGDSGFAPPLAGWRDPTGDFDYLGEYGIFWSGSPRDSSDAGVLVSIGVKVGLPVATAVGTLVIQFVVFRICRFIDITS